MQVIPHLHNIKYIQKYSTISLFRYCEFTFNFANPKIQCTFSTRPSDLLFKLCYYSAKDKLKFKISKKLESFRFKSVSAMFFFLGGIVCIHFVSNPLFLKFVPSNLPVHSVCHSHHTNLFNSNVECVLHMDLLNNFVVESGTVYNCR